MIHVAGIGECDFRNLPASIAVCNMAFPLLCIPLVYLLLPDMRLCDPISHLDTTRTELLGDEDVWETSFSQSGDPDPRPEQVSVTE